MLRASLCARMPRLCALRLAGYEPTAAYKEAVKQLAVASICNAAYQPPGAGFTADIQQSKRDKQARYNLGWHGGSHEAFLEAAHLLPHPAADDVIDLEEDVLAAIRLVVNKRCKIVQWRQARVQLLRNCAALVADLNTTIMAHIEARRPHVYAVVRTYNIAFLAVLIDALEHPDVWLARRFVHGFPAYGELAPCGVYSTGGALPKRKVCEVFNPHNNALWNRFLCISVLSRGRLAEKDKAGDAWAAIVAVWRRQQPSLRVASRLECAQTRQTTLLTPRSGVGSRGKRCFATRGSAMVPFVACAVLAYSRRENGVPSMTSANAKATM